MSTEQVALVSNSEIEKKVISSLPAHIVERTPEELAKRAGVEAMYDVDPKIWGRHVWRALHLFAYAYPESPDHDTQQAAFQFFESLRFILMCSNCRGNFEHNWHALDIRKHLHTRTALIEWLIMLHDTVNEETGKPPLDYEVFINSLMGDSTAVIDAAAAETKKSITEEPKKSTLYESAFLSAASGDGSSKKPQKNAIIHRQQNAIAKPKKTATVRPQPPPPAFATTPHSNNSQPASRKKTSGSAKKSNWKKTISAPPKPCPTCSSAKATLTPSTF